MAQNKPAPKKQSEKENRQAVIQSAWSGPLPPPSLLGHYDEIIPGSAERILTMAEKEQSHRHELEMSELRENVKLAKGDHWQIFFGQIFAFVIAITFILTGAFLVYHGAQLAGAFLSSIGVVSIVSAFLKKSAKDN